jgi:hypothetical protein
MIARLQETAKNCTRVAPREEQFAGRPRRARQAAAIRAGIEVDEEGA